MRQTWKHETAKEIDTSLLDPEDFGSHSSKSPHTADIQSFCHVLALGIWASHFLFPSPRLFSNGTDTSLLTGLFGD